MSEEITYKNGKYKGDLNEDLPDGKGEFKYTNGDVYNGDFRAGLKDGVGIYTYKSGETYEGDWKDDKKDGKGVYTYKNGVQYEGEWANNKRSGSGQLILPDGQTFTINYKDGKADVNIVPVKDGSVFEGSLSKGLPHGKGKYPSRICRVRKPSLACHSVFFNSGSPFSYRSSLHCITDRPCRKQ